MPTEHASRIDRAAQVSTLVEHIQTRYHDTHRRALVQLLTQSSQAVALGLDVGLVEQLASIGNALEQHMFKEEMRLFPMMEQGGNTLIGRLIEDLHREHGEHLPAVQELRCQLRMTQATGSAQRILVQLVQGIDQFARDLTEHIRLEDEVLFPLFRDSAEAARTTLIP
nr:hemerythrin domain-containing protein [uncultured Roseateles sp.]